MTTRSEVGLLTAERALHAAQLAGDVAALDRLLHDRLVAIGPDGARHTKDRDLADYRWGSSVITDLVEDNGEVLVAASTGVTFCTGTLCGMFGGPRRPGCAMPGRGCTTTKQHGGSSPLRSP